MSNFEAIRESVLSFSVEAIQQFGQILITEKLKINEFNHETQTRTTRTIQLNQPIVPLDIDVSPFDNSSSSKEGVSRTYKGHDGYPPNFAYLSTEGFLVNIQLREGKDHVQKGTKKFLKEAIDYSKQLTSSQICVRMDTGDDALENREA